MRRLTTTGGLALAFALFAACTGDLGSTLTEGEGGSSVNDDDTNLGGFDGSTGSGTGGFEEDDACEAVSQEADNQIRPVDIIWAIDTSPSMSAEKNAVRDNLNVFAEQIGQANIDVHVVMIAEPINVGGICIGAPLGTGNCPADHNPPTYHHNTQWVGSHNALGRFIYEYPEYKSALRETSVKYFAVVTDDSAESTAAWFTDQVNNLEAGWWDDWKMFGFFCANQDSGGTYGGLVQQTGGIAVELCQGAPNWQSVFDALAESVVEAKTLDCAWDIPTPPDGEQFDRDRVNVEYTPGDGTGAQKIYYVDSVADCGAAGGWYYDNNADPQSIRVCDQTCDTIQADLDGKIDILFGCQTEQIPK